MTVWRAYIEFCDRHPLPPAVNSALVTCLVAIWLIGIVLAAVFA